MLKLHAKMFDVQGEETRLQLFVELGAGSWLDIKQLTTDTIATRLAVTKQFRALNLAQFLHQPADEREGRLSVQKSANEEASNATIEIGAMERCFDVSEEIR